MNHFQKYDQSLNLGLGKKPKRKEQLTDLRSELRGPSQNRYGGQRTQKMRSFRGSKFGAASEGRSFSPDEVAAYEASLRGDNAL